LGCEVVFLGGGRAECGGGGGGGRAKCGGGGGGGGGGSDIGRCNIGRSCGGGDDTCCCCGGGKSELEDSKSSSPNSMSCFLHRMCQPMFVPSFIHHSLQGILDYFYGGQVLPYPQVL
jgi:hypothetical protein